MTQAEVLSIAAAHGVGPAQIGLKWIVQQGFPLTTAVWDLKYMRQDLDLWSWGNLTEAEMGTLSAVAGGGGLSKCQKQLASSCERARKAGHGDCLICCGTHQRPILQA